MFAEDALEILSDKPLVVAVEDIAVAVRDLLATCLQRDIPALIGPCPKGG